MPSVFTKDSPTTMKIISILFRGAALGLALSAASLQAATYSGTVTNKTTGKPAAGDVVVLVDLQAGMGEAARTATDAKGHYVLKEPGAGPYLIRATHQGAAYFIGTPQNGASGDIAVYDVAAKVQGVSIEADVIEAETANGQLSVNERVFVHNLSKPPTAQWSKRSFEIVLPADATVTGVQAQRPGGLPTTLKMDPGGQKGHYTFDFPIEPDEGEKDTLFQVLYTLPYAGGNYTFHSMVTLPAESFAVLLPKSMSLKAGAGVDFKAVQADPGLQTFLLKKMQANTPIEFTVSGSGSLPREEQGQQQGSAAGGQPGGGIGAPIESPDPLSKYKWWILSGLAVLMAAAAAFLLRVPAGRAATASGAGTAAGAGADSAGDAVLNPLKEELFRLESDRLSGAVSEQEYAEAKAALEVVLKRALNRK